jgi:hypothetical protein
MAHNRKDLSEQVIEEYLISAKACLDKRRKRGLLGYPATLILLCTIDAMGHGLLSPIKNRDTRLDVLQQPPFNRNLTNAQVDNLTNWYRHLLAHTATMAPNAFLTPDAQGEPFDFDTSGALTVIRVPVLYKVVKAAWEGRNESAFNPPPPRANKPLPTPPGSLSVTPIVSGIRKP